MSQDKAKGRQPDPFRPALGADNSENWKDFKESFDDYAYVEELYKGSPRRQVSIFRACLGDNNRQLLRTLDLGEILENDRPAPPEPCRTLKNIISKLDERFASHENIHFHRHLYSKIRQSENESVTNYVDRVLKAVKPCKFTAQTELVIHQLISGTCLEAARRIIFEANRNKEWSIDGVVALLKQTEANNEQLPAFRSKENETDEKILRLTDRKQGQKSSSGRRPIAMQDRWNSAA